jgi:hypothetical protein
MTQYELIPMLIGFGLMILFGILIYYIRHLQNSHAKERAFIINDWQNRFLEICQSLEAAKEETKAVKAQLIDQVFLIDEAERWKHKAGQEEIKKIVVIDREKVVSDSLADTKRLLDLELQDREQHEAIIDQQNAMIIELKDMVKNLIEKGKEATIAFNELTKGEVGIWMNPNYTGGFKQPRPISSLKPDEAILVNNIAERDGVLKQMEAEGLLWLSGVMPTKYTPDLFPNALGLRDGRIVSGCGKRKYILPASEFLPVEPKINGMDGQIVSVDEASSSSRDWSLPQAFPKDYRMKKGLRVVAIKSMWSVQIGTKGIVMEYGSNCYIDWENGKYRCGDKSALKINGGQPYVSSWLAPINPTDHPEHPQFKGKK